MSRVFVVQDAKFRNPVTHELQDKYDLKPAERYGKLVTVMGTGKVPNHRASQAMRQIGIVLHNFTESDFILVIGDPAAIAAACMVAATKTGGKVKLLRFDRASNDYEVVQLDLGDCANG